MFKLLITDKATIFLNKKELLVTKIRECIEQGDQNYDRKSSFICLEFAFPLLVFFHELYKK